MHVAGTAYNDEWKTAIMMTTTIWLDGKRKIWNETKRDAEVYWLWANEGDFEPERQAVNEPRLLHFKR